MFCLRNKAPSHFFYGANKGQIAAEKIISLLKLLNFLFKANLDPLFPLVELRHVEVKKRLKNLDVFLSGVDVSR